MARTPPSTHQAEELAHLRERQCIAQVFHDTLTQMLFTIGLVAEWSLNYISQEREIPQRLQTSRGRRRAA